MRVSDGRRLMMSGMLLWVSLMLGAELAVADQHERIARAGHQASFEKGRQKLSIQVGYGEGFGGFASHGKDAADARTAAIVSGWGMAISDLEAADEWYGGAWEVMIEGLLTLQADPQIGHGGGATINFRYNFLASQRLVPFMNFGAGVAGMDFDFDSASDGFNFILQAGPGVHWFITDRTALTGEIRWHHYSNAQTRERNSGIDTALFMVGTTIFLH